MDNGLHALSAPDHTLLSPALATAFPFTSCCPLFLFLHLPCPPLDCLNSQKHLCYTFYVFSFSTILRLNSTPLPLISYISCILCIYFYLLRFLSLSILFQAGASSYSLFVSTDFVLWEFSSAVNQQIAFFNNYSTSGHSFQQDGETLLVCMVQNVQCNVSFTLFFNQNSELCSNCPMYNI